MIALEPTPGGLRLSTPYDAAFLAAFKQAVPPDARTWQKPYWIVDPAYGAQVASLVKTYFGASLGPVRAAPSATEVRALEVQYIGRCKLRGLGAESSAYGYADGAWSVVFPETVLRAWFGAQDQRPDERPTYYAVLGVTAAASDDDIKRAYRRMARQWHPDTCKEPDAAEQFLLIKHAYDRLSDPTLRRKYDAGLALEASLRTAERGSSIYNSAALREYRAPLRCGYLLLEGQYKIGRFVVSKVLDWQDVVRNGKTMVASWDMENDSIKIEWV